MYFPKTQNSNSGLKFGSPKTVNNPHNPQGNKITFNKYPALSKNNLNISTDETYSSYSKMEGRVGSPTPQSQTQKIESKFHTRHATQITDSLQGSKTFTNNSSVALVQLEFQISSLKTQNKRIKQEYERRTSSFGAEKSLQIQSLQTKISSLNQQSIKDKIRIESLVSENQSLTNKNQHLSNEYQKNKNKLLETIKKSQQSSSQSSSLKQQLKHTKIQQSELQNIINKLETEISQVHINLKNSQQRLVEIKSNQDHYKNLVYTISQQKTLLNNRISQLIEDQAKLQNAEVITRSQQSNINFQKINQQLNQQITHLKKKINDLLNQQQSSSLKMLYENKIIIMEKQIQQLKYRYQSPETVNVSHDRSEQQWKGIVDQKNREITQLKNVAGSLQSKVTQLNKELLDSKSHKVSSNIPNYELQSQLNTLKIQLKSLKKALDTADEKLKYLINEGKKKDDFLKQYLSATVKKGEELTYINNFFKKYETEIPSQGFSNINLRELNMIKELEDKVNYLSNKLYGGR